MRGHLPLEYAVRNISRSPLRLALIVAGCFLVALIVTAAAGFIEGMRNGLTLTASDSNVILLSAGSEASLERSQIDSQTAGVAAAAIKGIRTRAGIQYVSPEIHMSNLL